MSESTSSESIAAFVEKYALRYVEKDRRFLGLFQGLCIDVWEYEGSVWLSFFSSTVQIADAVLDGFKGFTHVAQTGIQPEWLQYRDQGCMLELNRQRLAAISGDALIALPEAMALDFQDCGASPDVPVCSLCGVAGADKLMFANDSYQTACNTCFDHLRDFAPGGIVTREDPVHWKSVARALALWSAGFTLIWGLIQQSQEGVDIRLLLAGPFVASIYFCRAVGRAAQGMNLWVRVVTASCILCSIVAGNIWGLRTAILRQQPISWAESIEVYFTWALTHEESNAWWFLLGGLAGVWLGFGYLKNQNIVKYR